MKNLQCKKCHISDIPHLTYVEGNNAIKASCKVCGAYIKFLPTTWLPSISLIKKMVLDLAKMSNDGILKNDNHLKLKESKDRHTYVNWFNKLSSML